MLTAVLVFVVTLVAMLWWTSRQKNTPPSPGIALPLLGHLHLFKGNHAQQLNMWRQQLGNIYTVQIGPFKVVVLNSYPVISEVLQTHHENLTQRGDMFTHREMFQHTGIVSLGDDKWKEQRKFLQSALRALGVGRNIMGERIRIETDYLVGTLKSINGEPRDIKEVLMVCVTNVICGIIFGKRFDIEDENILHWMRVIKRFFEVLGSSPVLPFFPWLKHLPGDLLHMKEVCSLKDELNKTLLKWTDKDMRQIDVSSQEFDDLSQAYLTEIERKKQNGEVSTSLDEANFVSTIFGFFNAGTETTSGTILFALLYLVNYPDIQQRLYEEIKENVGTDRPPEMTDKTKLKFLTAFIMETQRLASIVPTAIDRLVKADIHVGSFTIEKGSIIFVNYDSILHDQEIWGDPENFRPERFLSEDGSVAYRKELLPFGFGKRNCIGESLATMELFLFISALIQRFEFLPENKDQMPTMTPDIGLARAAHPFKLRAVLRHP